ncbi:hypothetical protein QJQ45_004607 [Haematococcus lacustris]|nr:hypothetical protein QJQ45_004607 [Haematococcus lacustris]
MAKNKRKGTDKHKKGPAKKVKGTNLTDTTVPHRAGSNPRQYHVITTTQGFANHWQRQRQLCQAQGQCDMGGFTRLLHSGEADDLMDEVPTVVVKPIPLADIPRGDTSYIPLNRPYAFLQWVRLASVPERYILMCESDHLFLRPLPNLMQGEVSTAALFTYMNPLEYPSIVRSFIGKVPESELAQVPRIGNSPTFISVRDFRKLAPVWYNTTMEVFADPQAYSVSACPAWPAPGLQTKTEAAASCPTPPCSALAAAAAHGVYALVYVPQAWNWIVEMYGYTLATYRTGLHKGLLTQSFLAHPPFDDNLVNEAGQPYYLMHLTYPMRYNSSGKLVETFEEADWLFDKRSYGERPPPRNLPLPPAYVNNGLVALVINMLNEATNAIPCWDEYVATLSVTCTAQN